MRGLLFSSALLLLSSLQPCASEVVRLRQTQAFDFDSMVWTIYADSVMPNPLPAPHTQRQTLQFSGFDTSLGTLTDAYLSYEGDYAISFTIAGGTRAERWPESPVYGGRVVGNGTVDYSFSLTAPGAGGARELHGDTVWANVAGDRFSGIIWMKGYGTGPADGGGNTGVQPWIHAGDLARPLLGLADGLDVLGDTVDVGLDKQMNAFLWFSSFVDPDLSYITNFRNAWRGEIALTYVYDTGNPVPAPEPGSLLLVGTGLLALRAGARKARRALQSDLPSSGIAPSPPAPSSPTLL